MPLASNYAIPHCSVGIIRLLQVLNMNTVRFMAVNEITFSNCGQNAMKAKLPAIKLVDKARETTMTKFQLASLLFSKMGSAQTFKGSDGKFYIGWLVGVMKEDGGDRSYILTVNGCNNVKYTFHIRTID